MFADSPIPTASDPLVVRGFFLACLCERIDQTRVVISFLSGRAGRLPRRLWISLYAPRNDGKGSVIPSESDEPREPFRKGFLRSLV